MNGWAMVVTLSSAVRRGIFVEPQNKTLTCLRHSLSSNGRGIKLRRGGIAFAHGHHVAPTELEHDLDFTSYKDFAPDGAGEFDDGRTYCPPLLHCRCPNKIQAMTPGGKT
jgi:hypothetical protein